MRVPGKGGLIAFGYVATFALACLAVAINDASMDPVTRQGGMAAFGDSVLFLGVFGLGAAPLTGYALYTFRDRAALWRVLSISALVISGTAVASLLVFMVASAADPGPALELWGGIAVMRMFVAPLFSLAFAFIGLFAPNRFARFAFFGAAIVEAGTFAYAFLGMPSGVQQ